MLEDLFARIKADLRDVIREELRAVLGQAVPAAPPTKEVFVSADETAQMLSLHVATVRKLIRTGVLPGKKLPHGRKLLIRKSDVERFLEQTAPNSDQRPSGPRGTGDVDSQASRIINSIERKR